MAPGDYDRDFLVNNDELQNANGRSVLGDNNPGQLSPLTRHRIRTISEYSQISDCSEYRPHGKPQTQVYARRWYVLFVFCLLNMAQNIGWNTWGPVSNSATLVFGWSGAEIGLFAVVGNLTYALTVFAASYIMDALGLRTASLAMTAMLTVGAGVRCVSSDRVIQLWMSLLSALLCGVAGTVPFSGSALFSAIWFPASQRATATAMINTFNFLGVSATFLIGPAFVKYINPCPSTNTTAHSTTAFSSYYQPDFHTVLAKPTPSHLICNTTDNTTRAIIDKQRTEIMTYMYAEAGIMAGLFLLVLVYFPSRPPLPPSISASITRMDFRNGLAALTKNKSFWFLGLAYAIPSGLFNIWGTVLNVNLRPAGVTQSQAAQLGLYYNLAGGLAGLIVSRLSDLVSRHMKQILIILNILAAGCLVWIILIICQYIPFNLPSLYISACLASVFLNSGVALYYELSSEMCYPVAEGIIGGYLTLIQNMVGVIFLSLLYIPNIGTDWMNWTMLGGSLLSVPLLILVRAKYRRLQMDVLSESQEPTVNVVDPAI